MKVNSIFKLYYFPQLFLLLFFSCSGGGSENNDNKNIPRETGEVHLTGQVHESFSSDTAFLYYWEYYIREDMGKKVIKAAVRDGSFDIQISGIEHPGYFSLVLPDHVGGGPENALLDGYLISPGDSINLLIGKDSIVFSGKGAAKYQARYVSDKIVKSMQLPGNLRIWKPENQKERMDWYDSISAVKMVVLNRYRSQMTVEAFSILEAEIVGNREYNKYESYLSVSRRVKEGSIAASNLYRLYQEKLKSQPVKPFSNDIAHYSKGYTDFIIVKEELESRYGKTQDEGESFRLAEGYEMLKDGYSGKLRDLLVTKYLVNQYSQSSDQSGQDSCFSDALSFVSEGYLRNMLKKIHDHQRKGAVAYDFSLPDTAGNMVGLNDFKGKMVLLDFWFTGCRACTHYAKTLGKAHEAFKGNSDMVFMTISIDKDWERWRKSVAGGVYTAPGSINLFTDGKGSSHPIIKHYDIYGYPHPLLIDKEGKIYRSSGLHVGPDELIKILTEALDETFDESPLKI